VVVFWVRLSGSGRVVVGELNKQELRPVGSGLSATISSLHYTLSEPEVRGVCVIFSLPDSW